MAEEKKKQPPKKTTSKKNTTKKTATAKKQPVVANGHLVGHYFIPTYNLYNEALTLTTLKSNLDGKETDLHIWLVKATPGNEQFTMLESLVQQRTVYQIQYDVVVDSAKDISILESNINYLDHIISLIKDPEHALQVGDEVKTLLKKYLDKIDLRYSLEHAKLVGCMYVK